MNRLHEKGQIDDGSFLEFLHSHTSVVLQPGFDDRRFSGINPYALGFAMCCDIERVCTSPTDEDCEWFPDIAGAPWLPTLDHAMRNFKDEKSLCLPFSLRVSTHTACSWPRAQRQEGLPHLRRSR